MTREEAADLIGFRKCCIGAQVAQAMKPAAFAIVVIWSGCGGAGAGGVSQLGGAGGQILAGGAGGVSQLGGAGGQIVAGLLARWRLDDAMGSIAAEDAGRNGQIVQGSAAAAHPSPAWVAGRLGGAIDLDGIDDWIRIDHPELWPGDEATICAWVFMRATQPNGIRPIAGWDLRQGFGIHVMNAGIGVNVGRVYFAQVGGAPLNRWFHVCGVFDGSMGLPTYVKIYRDGALYLEDVTTTDRTYAGPFRLGNDGGSRFLGAALDDVRLYSRALAAPEVAAIAGE
jgi:hypothetical protein